jgi:protein TonB
MVERADPFPAPSAIDRDEFEIVVPVTFSIR